MQNVKNTNIFRHKHTQTLSLRFVSRHFAITRHKILYGSPESSLSKCSHLHTLFAYLRHLIRNGRAKNFIGYNLSKFILSTIW